jgi:photosystem II stability/assembly factor-like uncharacterized protein
LPGWLVDGRRGLGVSLAVEFVCVLLLGWLNALRISNDIPLRVVQVFGGQTPPGASRLSQIDWARLLGFLGDGALFAVLLISTAHILFRLSRGQKTLERRRQGWLLRATTIVCLCFALIEISGLQPAVVGWHPQSSIQVGTPDRWQSVVVLSIGGLAALTASFFGFRVLRKFRLKIGFVGWTAVTVAVVVLVGGLIADQRPPYRSSYQWVKGLTIPGTVLPLPVVQGFRTLTFKQVPATELLNSVECGTTNVCMAFGQGRSHNLNADYPEVVISVDGGRSWRSWLYPAANLFLFPEEACVAETCVASVSSRGDSILSVSITRSGVPRASLIGRTALFGPLACPSVAWCASIEVGRPGGLLMVTGDGGMTWTSRPVPAPAGEELAMAARISCPSVGHCIIPLNTTLTSAEAIQATKRHSSSGLVHAAFLVTTDAGQTWENSPPIPDAPGAVHSLTCPDDSTCWALLGDTYSSESSDLVTTSDGGKTWGAFAGSEPWGNAEILSASCWSVGHCTVITSAPAEMFKGRDYSTEDNGKSWVEGDAPGVLTLSCAQGGTCVGVLKNEIYAKTSLSSEWQKVALRPPRLMSGT